MVPFASGERKRRQDQDQVASENGQYAERKQQASGG